MGGVVVTDMAVPCAGCSDFMQALLSDGFRFVKPFELLDTEAAVNLTHNEMGDAIFMLDISAVSPPSPTRIISIIWWRLPGPNGQQRAEQIVQRIVDAAEAQGGTLIPDRIFE